MRIVFAGTPAFAVPALAALAAAGHDIVLVLTQPDRPAGRGMAPAKSAVKQAAESLGLEVFQPATLKDGAAVARLREAAPDLMIVVAYGLILPQAVLDVPPHGALNIHASLLPRWRGAAPIQRAILAGDAATGVCIMRMDAGLDTGPVLSCKSVPIEHDDTAGTLHDKLATLGGFEVVEAIDVIRRGRANAVPQTSEGVTYAAKIEKAEARIDWSRPAVEVSRRIRAFNPVPGAVTRLGDSSVKIWQAKVLPNESGAPGSVLRADAGGIVVACGEGALRVESLQRAGGRRLSAAEFIAGTRLAAGMRFEPVAD